MKTLAASEKALSKIFSDDYVFRIPGYQRPYAWTIDQAQELLDDFVAYMRHVPGGIEDVPPYFLGSIVLIKQPLAPEADVVDGQQRLTTLTILLAAIRATMQPEHATAVTQLLYQKGSEIVGTKDRFRITLRERDQTFFQDYVQKEDGFSKLVALNDTIPDSQDRIRSNARFFRDALQKMTPEERLRLAQFTATRCYLVTVETLDLDSAYRIFSVLNSRGLDLAPTDILKAEIIGSMPEQARDAYTVKWENIEEDLGREPFNDLFSQIRTVYRKAKSQGTLLREFKEHVTPLNDPERFIDDVLLPMSRAYEELTDAAYMSTSNADQVNRHLKWLNKLGFSDWVPPALTFLSRHRQESELVLTFVRDLERLAYWMLVCRKGINERIERFSQLTRAVEANTNLGSEESPLQLTPSEQAEMYRQLDGPLYQSLAARARAAVMLRLDALMSGGGASYDYETVSVEHVLPQNPRDSSKWIQWFPDELERASWVHRLGNLALLTRKKNSSANNYEFDVKKQSYFSKDGVSPFVLTTQVLNHNEWTVGVVANRQQELLYALSTHWRLDHRADEHNASFQASSNSTLSDPKAYKTFLIEVDADAGVEFRPLKEWLRKNPEILPKGLDPVKSTSHQLRDGLKKLGWKVEDVGSEVRLRRR